MNSEEIIKCINTHFKNIVDDKIKAFEQSVIKNYNFEKIYKLKNPILRKHFIINAIEEFNNILALENKNFRVNFDEDTKKYFIRKDHDYFQKQGCISDDEKIRLSNLYKEKCELNRVIRENTDNKKLKMIPIVIHKYFGYPLDEITVK